MNNIDTNKLTDLSDKLKHYKREIQNKTDNLNSECEYIKYNQHIYNLDFSIYGLKPNLDDIEDVAKRLETASETHTECYIEISEVIETDPWSEWSVGDLMWFKFYGDLNFTEEEIQQKKDKLRVDIEKLELKCKEIESEIREMVMNEI